MIWSRPGSASSRSLASEVFVRTASERDLPAISALLAETWHATYDGLYGAAGVTDYRADGFQEALAFRRHEENGRHGGVAGHDGR